MKAQDPKLALAPLCRLFGMTRQAFYKAERVEAQQRVQGGLILDMVRTVRRVHPRLGGRKLYHLLKPRWEAHGIKLGRDKFFDLLAGGGMLIRRKRSRRTTYSLPWYRKYPNLVRGLDPTGPHQLWVSDITYVPCAKGFFYLSLITDAYSRKVVGHCLGPTLETRYTLQALRQALVQYRPGERPLIHHSDRGLQYGSHQYIQTLWTHDIAISMSENSDPLENAIAERVNGIIKEEYYDLSGVSDLEQARTMLDRAIHLYNEHRPHMSCNMLTPAQAHTHHGALKRQWKNYYNGQRKNTAVNLFQDYERGVNHLQDLSS